MSQPSFHGIPLKYISLVTLTLQNSLLTILLHYSRTSGAAYSSALAVLMNELLKGSISFLVALRNTYQTTQNHGNGSSTPLTTAGSRSHSPSNSSGSTFALLNHGNSPGFRAKESDDWRRTGQELGIRLRKLRREIFSPDCWKLSIPAILYVIQNNLQFVAASNLDVATFQVSYQMKILTTALFSVIMLHRRLTLTKWLSLLCLAIGVGIVQIQNASGPANPASHHVLDPTKGFIAVAAACMTSGLAGVYFEMVLKGSTTDLWIRNVQLSIFSLIPALAPMLFSDFNPFAGLTSSPPPQQVVEVPTGGFLLPGFGFWAWATVLCQVLGGLVTALVIKFSDNIMKGFATSLSIVLSFVAGIVLFNFHITTSFIVGCSIVLGATYYYNMPESNAGSMNGNGIAAKMIEKERPPRVVSGSAINVNFDSPEKSTLRRQYDSTSPVNSVFSLHQHLESESHEPESPLVRVAKQRGQSATGTALPGLAPEEAPLMHRTPSGSWVANLAGIPSRPGSAMGDAEKGEL